MRPGPFLRRAMSTPLPGRSYLAIVSIRTYIDAKCRAATSFGLTKWSEFGLPDLDIERFRTWTGQLFCRRNVIVTFHNEIPENLSFDGLRAKHSVKLPAGSWSALGIGPTGTDWRLPFSV